MTLQELLKHHNIAWPEGATHAVQDEDGWIKFATNPNIKLLPNGCCDRGSCPQSKGYVVPDLPLASDWDTAIVSHPHSEAHPHAVQMLQYAQDAMTTSEPWKLWQVQDGDFGGPKGEWWNLEEYSNLWIIGKNYRRKPITKRIHGVEVPDISFTPEDNEYYFYPDPTMPCMYEMEYFHNYAEECGHRLTNKMCYPTTDEGREAAILHAKIMLGIYRDV